METAAISEQVKQTKQWLKEVVLGLNLCPYAHQPFAEDSIRYAVANSSSMEKILQQLIEECQYLDQQPQVATTLLILPTAVADFDDYLDLLSVAEQLLIAQGYQAVYQLASFHPDYCFAGVDEADASNFSNRSPWPMLHIIREEMLSAIIDQADTEAIPERNIAACQLKGVNFFERLLAEIKS